MISEERRRKLLESLNKSGSLSVADASDQLNVSRMTVHRDLDRLCADGLLRKVHGGAVPVITTGAHINLARPFKERKPASATAKQMIGKHLAKILDGAQNLALDASSTVFHLAHTLRAPEGNANLFVITNGIPIFLELQRRNAGFRLAITGGEAHPRTGSLIGPLAIRSLEGIRFDFAVVSAAGLMEDDGNVYDSTPEGTAIKLAFLARANKRILAIDKTKLNFLAPYPMGMLTDFDLLVTEDGVTETERRHHHHKVT